MMTDEIETMSWLLNTCLLLYAHRWNSAYKRCIWVYFYTFSGGSDEKGSVFIIINVVYFCSFLVMNQLHIYRVLNGFFLILQYKKQKPAL